MDEAHMLPRDARRKRMLEEPVAKVVPLAGCCADDRNADRFGLQHDHFVSRFGTAATAAVGVSDSLIQLIRALAMGFSIGASSCISRLLGVREYEKASCVDSTSLLTAFFMATALPVIAYLLMNPLVVMLGAMPTVKPYSIQYGNWILVSSSFSVGTVI